MNKDHSVHTKFAPQKKPPTLQITTFAVNAQYTQSLHHRKKPMFAHKTPSYPPDNDSGGRAPLIFKLPQPFIHLRSPIVRLTLDNKRRRERERERRESE
jgi:hypothetical protein